MSAIHVRYGLKLTFMLLIAPVILGQTFSRSRDGKDVADCASQTKIFIRSQSRVTERQAPFAYKSAIDGKKALICCNARDLGKFPVNISSFPKSKKVDPVACCVAIGSPCSTADSALLACCGNQLCQSTNGTCVKQFTEVTLARAPTSSECADMTKRDRFYASMGEQFEVDLAKSILCCDGSIRRIIRVIDYRKHCCLISNSKCDVRGEAFPPCCGSAKYCRHGNRTASSSHTSRLLFCDDNLSGSEKNTPNLNQKRPHLGPPTIFRYRKQDPMIEGTTGRYACCNGTKKIFLERGCCDSAGDRFADLKTLEKNCCSADPTIMLTNKCPPRGPKPVPCPKGPYFPVESL